MNNFIEIVKKDQFQLHDYLKEKLEYYGYKIVDDAEWLYGFSQTEPVLLTAHLDTVFKETVKNITIEQHDNKTIISSPQGIGGDDRCGVWMILNALEAGYRPAVLFCHDEEVGGVGSNNFCLKANEEIIKDITQLKYMIEIDRANKNDAVFYDCDNPEFTKYIESFGFKEAIGSFSDISHLAPHFEKAAVNISTGDYKQHMLEEYVVFEELLENYERLKKMLSDSKNCESYEYIEAIYSYNKWFSRRDYGYYDDYGSLHDRVVGIDLIYREHGELLQEAIYGETVEHAIGEFLMEHPDICYNDVEIQDIWEDYF